jgi:hypothetical protein
MADYHTKPLLTARVPRESLDWARGEAERRGEAFGDFVDGLLIAERDRVAERLCEVDAPAPAALQPVPVPSGHRPRRALSQVQGTHRGHGP